MIKVWMLIIFLNGDARGYGVNGPMVIDNIYSRTECERVAEHIKTMENQRNSTFTKCVEVWKAR